MPKPQPKTLMYYDVDEVLAYLTEKYGADVGEYMQEIIEYFVYHLPITKVIAYEDKNKLYYLAPIFVQKQQHGFNILFEEFGGDINFSIGE